MTNDSKAAAILGLAVGVGLGLGGYFVGQGLFAAQATKRVVTVRGLAEREMPADLVNWPIVFTASGNDLSTVQKDLEAATVKVDDFLASHGFPEEVRSTSSPRVSDYSNRSDRDRRDRYRVETTVTVRSSEVEGVRQAMARVGELVKQGVAVTQGRPPAEFLFTRLDEVKPDMIAEATRDARRAAEQFANDSGSRVGSIRTATQGYFSIQNRDQFSPEIKRVRVVTTVHYFLID